MAHLPDVWQRIIRKNHSTSRFTNFLPINRKAWILMPIDLTVDRIDWKVYVTVGKETFDRNGFSFRHHAMKKQLSTPKCLPNFFSSIYLSVLFWMTRFIASYQQSAETGAVSNTSKEVGDTMRHGFRSDWFSIIVFSNYRQTPVSSSHHFNTANRRILAVLVCKHAVIWLFSSEYVSRSCLKRRYKQNHEASLFSVHSSWKQQIPLTSIYLNAYLCVLDVTIFLYSHTAQTYF